MTAAASGGEPCRKVRFPTLAAADAALLEAKLARLRRPGGTRRRERRHYWHADCGAYHLTSRPDREEAHQ